MGTPLLEAGRAAARERKPAAVAAKAFAPFLLASALSGGCGVVAGDERSNWLPASLPVAAESPESKEGAVPAYAGLDSSDIYGIGRYYRSLDSVPSGEPERQARLVGLLFESLSQDYDFGAPAVKAMLSNDVFLFMTDADAWPVAIFSKDLARMELMKVLSLGGSDISDCGSGACIRSDVIAINNKGGLFPEGSTLAELGDGEQSYVRALGMSLSEELVHDYWADALDGTARASFISGFRSLWEASSGGMEADLALAESWQSGGIAFAVGADGSIASYALRPRVLESLSSYCVGCGGWEMATLEAAVVAYLQLIGDQAESLCGGQRNYLEYYKREDAAAGKAEADYLSYRERFISRESFAHIGRSEQRQRAAPAFFRPSFAAFCSEAHLDRSFSDGLPGAFHGNPYLADPAALAALVNAVVPPALQPK